MLTFYLIVLIGCVSSLNTEIISKLNYAVPAKTHTWTFQNMSGFSTFSAPPNTTWRAGDRSETNITHLVPTAANKDNKGKDDNTMHYPAQSPPKIYPEGGLYSEVLSQPLRLSNATIKFMYFMAQLNSTKKNPKQSVYICKLNADSSHICYDYTPGNANVHNAWTPLAFDAKFNETYTYYLNFDATIYAADQLVAINYVEITNKDGFPVIRNSTMQHGGEEIQGNKWQWSPLKVPTKIEYGNRMKIHRFD